MLHLCATRALAGTQRLSPV